MAPEPESICCHWPEPGSEPEPEPESEWDCSGAGVVSINLTLDLNLTQYAKFSSADDVSNGRTGARFHESEPESVDPVRSRRFPR